MQEPDQELKQWLKEFQREQGRRPAYADLPENIRTLRSKKRMLCQVSSYFIKKIIQTSAGRRFDTWNKTRAAKGREQVNDKAQQQKVQTGQMQYSALLEPFREAFRKVHSISPLQVRSVLSGEPYLRKPQVQPHLPRNRPLLLILPHFAAQQISAAHHISSEPQTTRIVDETQTGALEVGPAEY